MNINYHKSSLTVVLFLIVGLTLGAGPAWSQDELLNDRILLRTLDGGICVTAEFLQHVTMEIVLACASYSLVQGFELGLRIDNMFLSTLTATFPMPVPDPGVPPPPVPEFWQVLVGYPYPIPTAADTFVVATVDIFYLDTEPLYFHQTAYSPLERGRDIPGLPGAIPAWVVQPMTPSTRTGEDWDFAVNAGCTTPAPASFSCGAVPDESLSWGAVKSLYR